MGAQAVAVVSNLGTWNDVWMPGYNLMRNDNTSVVNSVNEKAVEFQDDQQEWRFDTEKEATITEAKTSWTTILTGAGIGGLLGYMLNDSNYAGYGKTLPRWNCASEAVEVIPSDNDGNSKTISTVVGAGLGALLAYLAQPTVKIVPDPSTGRDRYLAELAYKQQLDAVGVRAVGPSSFRFQ